MLDIIDAPSGSASINMIVQEDLYSAEEAQLLLSCYISLLAEFTENSNAAVGNVTMFDPQEVDLARQLGKGMLFAPAGSFHPTAHLKSR